jgi:hypothetical protein
MSRRLPIICTIFIYAGREKKKMLRSRAADRTYDTAACADPASGSGRPRPCMEKETAGNDGTTRLASSLHENRER